MRLYKHCRLTVHRLASNRYWNWWFKIGSKTVLTHGQTKDTRVEVNKETIYVQRSNSFPNTSDTAVSVATVLF